MLPYRNAPAAQVLPDFQKNASQEAAMSQQFDRPTHLPASREAQTLYNQLQAPNFTADQEIYPSATSSLAISIASSALICLANTSEI